MLTKIWVEGFSTPAISSKASCLGRIHSRCFIDACHKMAYECGWDIIFRIDKKGNPRYWGCRMFDNETDARALFG